MRSLKQTYVNFDETCIAENCNIDITVISTTPEVEEWMIVDTICKIILEKYEIETGDTFIITIPTELCNLECAEYKIKVISANPIPLFNGGGEIVDLYYNTIEITAELLH